MDVGSAFSGLSWVAAGALQLVLDAGTPVSIVWQVLPYALLTFGEVLVSATGLDFAYSQAPAPMKGAILAFWSLSVTVGNLWVLLVNKAVLNDSVKHPIGQSELGVTSFSMFFFAGFAYLASLLFGVYAARYPVADHYRKAGAYRLCQEETSRGGESPHHFLETTTRGFGRCLSNQSARAGTSLLIPSHM